MFLTTPHYQVVTNYKYSNIYPKILPKNHKNQALKSTKKNLKKIKNWKIKKLKMGIKCSRFGAPAGKGVHTPPHWVKTLIHKRVTL